MAVNQRPARSCITTCRTAQLDNILDATAASDTRSVPREGEARQALATPVPGVLPGWSALSQRQRALADRWKKVSTSMRTAPRSPFKQTVCGEHLDDCVLQLSSHPAGPAKTCGAKHKGCDKCWELQAPPNYF